MSLLDIILLGIVALAVGLAVRKLRQNKKRGCAGNCACCSGCPSMGRK